MRLSDWLGPDEELVPFGPRALAHEPAGRTADPASGAEPPGASGFWDGDTSVHTAVPGPGIFDEPDERAADRRGSLRWRPARPRFQPAGRGSHPRERLVELVDRISWQWATAGTAMVGLIVVALVAMLGGSSGHRERNAQASIAGQPRLTLSATLADIGTATRGATALRQLPSVDAAVRRIGVATRGARSLQARHRPHVVAAPASVPSSATTGSVETPTTATAPAPAETTSAPSESEPVQTTSDPTSTTGGGSSAAGGGSTSGSQHQSAFGAGGSLGPGSSPNG